MSITKKKYPNRGFASMTQEQRSAIAAAGGRAAHRRGTAHQWTVEEARTAGSKGGRLSAQRRREARGLSALANQALEETKAA